MMTKTADLIKPIREKTDDVIGPVKATVSLHLDLRCYSNLFVQAGYHWSRWRRWLADLQSRVSHEMPVLRAKYGNEALLVLQVVNHLLLLVAAGLIMGILVRRLVAAWSASSARDKQI